MSPAVLLPNTGITKGVANYVNGTAGVNTTIGLEMATGGNLPDWKKLRHSCPRLQGPPPGWRWPTWLVEVPANLTLADFHRPE